MKKDKAGVILYFVSMNKQQGVVLSLDTPSIHYLSMLVLCRVAGGLESVPADSDTGQKAVLITRLQYSVCLVLGPSI